MNHQPLVTVYIPTYNRLELLKRAVKSVQDQTYQNLEIIIVDDCSTDGTQEFLPQLANEDQRIRYFIKEQNSGACVSRNIAIENSTGAFITGLDDDDYFKENRIKEFVDNWEDKYNLLFSNLLYKKSENNFQTNYRFAMKNIVSQKDLLKANHIGNQIFTKTEKLKGNGGFDSNMLVWQDLECWYRVLGSGLGKRIVKELYVVDISHEHERISNNKGTKVSQTFDYFCRKHDLTNEQRFDLETHMTNYKDIDLSILVYIRKFRNYKSLGNMLGLIKKIIGFNYAK